jgi:hypothetical protein
MSGGAKMGPTFSGQATAVATAESNGWITHDFTSSPADVSVPSTLSSAANFGTISLSSSGSLTLNGGDYKINALSVLNNSSLKINGDVRLYILGNVSVKNSGSINITANSSLTVYVAGPTLDLSGAGIINTGANGLRPVNNQWYGLPTLNSGSIANSGAFIGTFYAPSAKVTISGAAAISGSCVASNIVLAGSGGIHFDESLKGSGGSGTSYSAVSWQELRYVGGSWIL